MEVVERGEFLLGDDAGALECDALSALDGYLDALREESGVESGVDVVRLGRGCRGRGIWSR